MSEFKVGDRVKYIGSKSTNLAGGVGVITRIGPNGFYPVQVDFPELMIRNFNCLPSSLELVEMNKNGANDE